MNSIPQFPEIGRIRKGAQKTANRPGEDLKYFRFELDENETEAKAAIAKLYPEKPASLRIWLPFKTVEENFWWGREAYVAGGLLHRCSVQEHWEDRTIEFQRDGSGQTIISHGKPRQKCKDGESVGSWKNRETGEIVQVYCRPVGRLKIILPELQRLVFFTVLTTSIHDIENLKNELGAYEQMGPKGLAGIPLILKRVPKKISRPDKKEGRVRCEKWLLHLEVDPRWAQKLFVALTNASMPDLPALEPPKGITEAEWTEEDTDEDEQGQDFSRSIPDENFGSPVEEGTPTVPWVPDKVTATMYYSMVDQMGLDKEDAAQVVTACKVDGKPDFRAAWEKFVRSNVPPESWPKKVS